MVEAENREEHFLTNGTKEVSVPETVSPVAESSELDLDQKFQNLWQQISEKFPNIEQSKINALVRRSQALPRDQVLVLLQKQSESLKNKNMDTSAEEQNAYLKLEKSIQDLYRDFEIKKEKRKLDDFINQIKDTFPLAGREEFRQWIQEISNKDPFVTLAFLTDFLKENKADFPYSENEEKWPLGQEKRYGNWDLFAQEFQKLATISDINEFKQQVGRCFDFWKSAFLEHARGSQNDKRVSLKQQRFVQIFLRNFPNQNPTELEKACKQKRAEQGTLTFEVFLDDLLNKPGLLKEGSLAFSDVYAQREKEKIEQLGKANMSIEAFEKVLELSSSNNKALKEKAAHDIKELRNKGLTLEQIVAENERINNEALMPAVKGYGMLNREEVIKTAFIGLEKKDYQQWGLFFKKIQVIGKKYYGYKGISIDGIWGPQTEGTLRALRSETAFQEQRALIDKILKNNKTYGEKSQNFAKKLQENYKEGVFDKKNAEKKSNADNRSSEVSIDAHEKEVLKKNRNQNLQESLNALSPQEVDGSIPRDEYLKAIEDFLQKQEAIPLDMRSDLSLPMKVLDWTWSGEEFDAIKALWENKAKPEFLRLKKEELQQKIKTTLNERVKSSRDNFFRTVWLPLTYDPSITKAYEKEYGKSEWTYSVFTDPNNPDDHYIFNHSSGYLSIRKKTALDKEKKHIAMNADEYGIILRFPTAQELSNQALDITSYLPKSRPNTLQDLDETLSDGLNQKVAHSVGDIEVSLIWSSIEKNRLENRIISSAKEVFNINPQKNFLSVESDRAYYEIMTPILNTIKNCKTNTDLQVLLDFFEQIKRGSNEKNTDAYKDGRWKLFIDPKLKKEFEQKGSISSKSEFPFWRFLQSLETTPEGVSWELENKVLNLEKIKFLNESLTEEKRLLHPVFWAWYLKTKESEEKKIREKECEQIAYEISKQNEDTSS